MKTAIRTVWHNHTGNQSVQPQRICYPTTLDEVVALVREAEAKGVTVRAVGSGHAWSDAALTTGFLVDTTGLGRVLEVDANLLRPAARGMRLVRTEAGIPLRLLNAHLDSKGLGLFNMGGYDAQTVAGVMSTATHGSGVRLGPIADQVRSLELVGGGGRLYRVEPATGPTDPEAFARSFPGWTLKQDDDWFYSTVVGAGCMGVIYAATLEVKKRYWLKEVRTLSTWKEQKAALRAGGVLRENEHYEVYFNPYAVNGEHRCLVTTRNEVPAPHNLPQDKLERNPILEIAEALPITHWIMHWLFDAKPKITPELIDRGLEALVDDGYTNVSYKVLNIGAANKLPAYSMEIGVPLDSEGRYLDSVDRIMAVAAERARDAEIYHTSPVALRFVKGSPAYLAMMHGVDTMMIELIMVADTEGGLELLGTHEEELAKFGGRPHWGQVNYLAGGRDRLRVLYPRYDDWQRVRGEIDPQWTFASPFTKRVGISPRGFGR